MLRSGANLDARRQLCDTLRRFYERGWVSGTGGGICRKLRDDELLLAPSSVAKERLRPREFFVVSLRDGRVLQRPQDSSLRPSECNAVFRSILINRRAGSVVHSHALSAVLVSDLAEADDHLVIAGFEMLKGIHGGSNREVHRVPVIDNTAEEFELAGTVADVLQRAQFAPTRCVLVRDHGAYVWGEDVEEATRHPEVYHFLFEGVLERRRIREGRR